MDDVTAAADGEVLSTVSLSMYANMRCDGDAGTAAATAATDCRGTRINIIITTSLSVSSSVTTSHRLTPRLGCCLYVLLPTQRSACPYSYSYSYRSQSHAYTQSALHRPVAFCDAPAPAAAAAAAAK